MKSHILHSCLEAAYCQMTQDEQREQEANEWIEGVVEDVNPAKTDKLNEKKLNLKQLSLKVRKESIAVNAEFSRIEHDFEVL